MNDRFKFRAWNKLIRKYIPNIQDRDLVEGGLSDDDRYFDSYLYDDNFVIEQCTGLKDKNGKLIYEGDILKFAINDPEEDYFYGEVRYSSENWKYELVSENKTFCLCQVLEQDIEVIGDVHNNPELLEEK